MSSSPHSPSWLHARALWAGLSIMTMWLAVLFVGIFGGNILNSTPGGTSSSVPVVVVVVPFVLIATIVVGRRGFRDSTDQQQAAPEGPVRPAVEAAPEPSELRTRLA